MKATMVENECMLEIEHGKESIAAARELGDYMNALQLPAEQHNRLVELTIAQVLVAEKSAFGQGLELGFAYGRFEANNFEKE